LHESGWAPFFGLHRADEFDVGAIFEAIARDFGFRNNFDGVGAFYAPT
jgi:hypothetical protein